jgi:hypothetical protein
MRLVPTRRRLFSGILTLAMIGGLLVLSAVPAWAISLSPTALDFGKVRIGATETIDIAVTLTPGYQIGSISTSNFHVVDGGAGNCLGVVGPAPCALQYFGHPTGVGVVNGLFSVSECLFVNGGGCNAVQSSWTIEGVANVAPACQDVSASVRAGSAVDLNLDCTDTDPITYAVITPPQHGSATLTPATGAVNYVPDTGYTGPDSFTYQADDGLAYPASNVATTNIDVLPRPDRPSPTPTERFVLNLSRVGKGWITSDPAGINCGKDCTGDFAEGSHVTLTAKARAGWEFKRWRYRCKGQGKVCTIDVTSNFRAVAVFVRPPIVGEDRDRS